MKCTCVRSAKCHQLIEALVFTHAAVGVVGKLRRDGRVNCDYQFRQMYCVLGMTWQRGGNSLLASLVAIDSSSGQPPPCIFHLVFYPENIIESTTDNIDAPTVAKAVQTDRDFQRITQQFKHLSLRLPNQTLQHFPFTSPAQRLALLCNPTYIVLHDGLSLTADGLFAPAQPFKRSPPILSTNTLQPFGP